MGLRSRSARVLAALLCAAAGVYACSAPSDETIDSTMNALLSSYENFESFPAETWAEGSTHGKWNVVFNGGGAASIKTVSSSTYNHVLSARPAAATSASETHATLVRGTESFGNVDVQVSLKTVSQLRTNPNPWEVAWFVWHFTDNDHFYYVILKPNGWELGKRDPAYPGGQRFLATGSSPTYATGTWHKLRVQQSDGQISITADGAALTTFTDAERPYLNGVLAFYTEDASAQFDNVSIDGPTGSTDASAPTDASTDASTSATGSMLYGVTVDDVSNLSGITQALAGLPKRPTTRIVFDQGQPPSAYTQAVNSIHTVSNVMGEILDSEYVKNISLSAYTQRTSNYLAAFPNTVDIWEIGNEINGEWLGPAADVAAKMAGAYDLVKAAGKKTELTLYGCSDAGNQFDMINWVNANVPARMKTGLDYVLVSYYEGDCGNPRSDWQSAFQQLRQIFPNSALGFGEVGAVDANGNRITDTTIAGAYLQKYYGMKIDVSNYVGGYFWWYFAEDMVPKTNPMYPILSTAIAAMP